MVDHSDHELGRLVDELKRLGRFDDTLFVVLCDNGASQEGGAGGTTNIVAYENGHQPDLAFNLARLDTIGGPRSQTNYPKGWAQVGNTPLKRYKQNTHAGGVRAPMIMAWPAGIDARNEVRPQFHHVIDVTPTILDLAGVRAPRTYNGIAQLPIHGLSMRYTFGEPDAPTRRHTQYFEMFSHRAIWHDGWKAVSFHRRGQPYAQDAWELYRLDRDFSECRDLAGENPDVLARLVELWWAEAGKYGVLPLDDRGFTERAVRYQPNGSPRRRDRLTLYPGMSRIPSGAAPLFIDRGFRIVAHVRPTGAVPQGVIVALGDLSGGFTFFVKEGRLAFEYNFEGTPYRVETTGAGVGVAARTLAVAFERRDELAAFARLFVDDVEVGRGDVPHTAKWFLSWSPLDVGRNASRVSGAYDDAFPFTRDALDRVEIELEPKPALVDVHPID
jgi:arylsulfatase